MRKLLILGGAAILMAASGALSAGALAKDNPAKNKTELVPDGEAESCIPINQIRDTPVKSDGTIDFRMNNGKTYRNQLPNACPGLGFEKAFSYSTSLSQLCSTDIITVIHQGAGPWRGASCGLGKFQPMKKVVTSPAPAEAADAAK